MKQYIYTSHLISGILNLFAFFVFVVSLNAHITDFTIAYYDLLRNRNRVSAKIYQKRDRENWEGRVRKRQKDWNNKRETNNYKEKKDLESLITCVNWTNSAVLV